MSKTNKLIKMRIPFKLLILLLTTISFLSLGKCLFAQGISGRDLIDNAHFFDKRSVEIEGEVIGDIMVRGDYAWINVNDGSRAIGVWSEKRMVKNIEFSGSYRNIGDTVKVIGIFNRSCPQHGGDLDIHASEISIIKKGHAVDHPVNPNKVLAAVILFLVVVAVVSIPAIMKLIKFKP
jgi:aspartyl/asparaginyl-tRNA synthetase